MQLTVEKKHLVSLVQKLQGVVPHKSPMRVLTGIHLSSKDGRLALTASDLAVSMRASTYAEGTQGSCIVNAKDLLRRLESMPDGTLDLRLEDQILTIREGRRQHAIGALPGEEFPVVKAVEGKSFVLDKCLLRGLLDRSLFAVLRDDSRPHLNSLLVRIQRATDGAGSIRIVATDGHVLATDAVDLPECSVDLEMLLSLKSAMELRSLCNGTGSLVVTANASSISFGATDETILFCPQVAATFPPYEQVIPREQPKRVTADRKTLLEMFKAVSLGSREGLVNLVLTKGRLELQAQGPESGKSQDWIDAEYQGGKTSVGLNARYMVEILSALGSAQIQLQLKDDLDPIVIIPSPEGISRFLAVVMPVRL